MCTLVLDKACSYIYITVDERKKKEEEQRKRERRNDGSRKESRVENEKSGKSRRKEESATGTSSKRSVQEILEQARGDSTSEPVSKRICCEEMTNLDEEDKVCN